MIRPVLLLVCGIPLAGAVALLLLPRGAALAARVAGVCAAATMGMAVLLWWRGPAVLGVNAGTLRLMTFVAAVACVALALAWGARRPRMTAWGVVVLVVEAGVLGALAAHPAALPSAAQANCDKPPAAVTLPARHGDAPLDLMAFASCGDDHPSKPVPARAKH